MSDIWLRTEYVECWMSVVDNGSRIRRLGICQNYLIQLLSCWSPGTVYCLLFLLLFIAGSFSFFWSVCLFASILPPYRISSPSLLSLLEISTVAAVNQSINQEVDSPKSLFLSGLRFSELIFGFTLVKSTETALNRWKDPSQICSKSVPTFNNYNKKRKKKKDIKNCNSMEIDFINSSISNPTTNVFFFQFREKLHNIANQRWSFPYNDTTICLRDPAEGTFQIPDDPPYHSIIHLVQLNPIRAILMSTPDNCCPDPAFRPPSWHLPPRGVKGSTCLGIFDSVSEGHFQSEEYNYFNHHDPTNWPVKIKSSIQVNSSFPSHSTQGAMFLNVGMLTFHSINSSSLYCWSPEEHIIKLLWCDYLPNNPSFR